MLCFWPNFHCYKCSSNIEKNSHLVTLVWANANAFEKKNTIRNFLKFHFSKFISA